MASDITLSTAVRSNLLSLQKTAELLGKTQEKLATGLKVNSALDDPTAFFTASGLNSRANDLSRLQDFVSNSIQTLKAADEGISAITKLVESAEATARQALNSAGNQASATGNVDVTGSGFFDFEATSTGTTTVNIANFDDFAASQTGTGVDIATDGLDLTAQSLGVGGLNAAGGVIAAANDGQTFTVSDGTTTTANITLAAGDDVDALVTKINAAITTAGFNANTVASNQGGQLRIVAANTTTVTVTDTGTAGASAAIGHTSGATSGVDATVDGTGGFAGTGLVDATSNGQQFTISDGTTTTAAITLAQGDDASAVLTKIQSALTAAGGINITASLNSGQIQLDSTENGSITVTDVGGSPGASAELGFTSAATTNASNALGLAQGDQFTINGTQLTFGTGASEFNSVTELTNQLNGISGVSASVDGTTGELTISTTDGSNLVITQDTGTIATDLGITTLSTTAQNSLGIQNGSTFTVQAGTAAAQTITFGSGGSEVNTLSELTTALSAISNISATVSNNNLSISATNGETLTLTDGTNSPLATLGVGAGTFTSVNGANIAIGDTFSVQVGSASATTITFGTGTGQVNSQATLLSALNAVSNVEANITDDGYLSIDATNGEDLTVGEGINTPLADLGITAGTTSASANADRSDFAAQFNELRSQINQLAADASYNGNNLLAGDDVTVTFNEDATSTLTIEGVNFNANGLGVDAAVNTFQTDGDINAALSDLKTATDTLRSQASKFGSNLSVVEVRQDFTKELINVLETGAANLTLADTNEEGANLLALQTRQQLSSTALSLASQADQNVLRLF